MKIPFLNFRKSLRAPKLGDLRQPLFDLHKYWIWTLLSAALLFVVMVLLAARLFYFVYSEKYKQSGQSETVEDLINIQELKNAVRDRQAFITLPTTPPRDPSI